MPQHFDYNYIINEAKTLDSQREINLVLLNTNQQRPHLLVISFVRRSNSHCTRSLRPPLAACTLHQASYLSQISQIISMEKNLSCGEISERRI